VEAPDKVGPDCVTMGFNARRERGATGNHESV
jgi:hypothetical protein